jgi:predicted metal-dependent phosphoesterase TrpH
LDPSLSKLPAACYHSPMEYIDLHTHTTASDGSLSPAELVALADQAGLKAVAITDHDTVAGLEEAVKAGRGLEAEVVTGVEISIEVGLEGGAHLVGLWVLPSHKGLLNGLERLQQARRERNPRMLAKLNDLGLNLSMEEVLAQTGGGQVGRPHFAKALVAKGLASSLGEVFSRWLGAGAAAYVPKERMTSAEGIRLIREAGGVPVLAHPGLLALDRLGLESLLRKLKGLGLEGLEAYYSEHDEAIRRNLVSVAARLGLAVSGGSDFHGHSKPQVKLGQGKGDLRVPATLLAALRQRRDRIREEAANA